jgi:hypothetical protein
MLIRHASKMSAERVDIYTNKILESISETYLRECVDKISIPRHFQAQSRNNRWAAHWITQQLQSYGYQTLSQGKFANILTLPPDGSNTPCILVGAHYDTVPETPGADDNGSAVAALLACAKAIADYAPQTPVCFVAFNREEDGLMGSKDFVTTFLPKNKLKIAHAHILEMVGYCQHTPDSQQIPSYLPVRIPNIGNFLAIIGNQYSNALVDATLKKAKTYLPTLPVLGLKVYLGLENIFTVLKRSDQAPFWQAKMSAVMWTDTAEFRNPNYHWLTDTPETLDYTFLRQVTQLLIACVLTQSI